MRGLRSLLAALALALSVASCSRAANPHHLSWDLPSPSTPPPEIKAPPVFLNGAWDPDHSDNLNAYVAALVSKDVYYKHVIDPRDAPAARRNFTLFASAFCRSMERLGADDCEAVRGSGALVWAVVRAGRSVLLVVRGSNSPKNWITDLASFRTTNVPDFGGGAAGSNVGLGFYRVFVSNRREMIARVRHAWDKANDISTTTDTAATATAAAVGDEVALTGVGDRLSEDVGGAGPDAAAGSGRSTDPRVSEGGRGGARLWVFGHSLGGAVALMAAAYLDVAEGLTPRGVYTYGCPRVGDASWARAYRLSDITLRFENTGDIVPTLPFGPAWRHVGAAATIKDCGGGLNNTVMDTLANVVESPSSLPLALTEAAGVTTEAAGMTTEAAGVTTEAAGMTTEAAGVTTEAAGVTTEAVKEAVDAAAGGSAVTPHAAGGGAAAANGNLQPGAATVSTDGGSTRQAVRQRNSLTIFTVTPQRRLRGQPTDSSVAAAIGVAATAQSAAIAATQSLAEDMRLWRNRGEDGGPASLPATVTSDVRVVLAAAAAVVPVSGGPAGGRIGMAAAVAERGPQQQEAVAVAVAEAAETEVAVAFPFPFSVFDHMMETYVRVMWSCLPGSDRRLVPGPEDDYVVVVV